MADIKSVLEEKGYCVIPNILDANEVSRCVSSFQQWQQTIVNHDVLHERINFHGIYKFHNAGHTWHSWFVRTRPKVQQVFKSLWECDNLIVSFDGCCYISKTSKKKDNCWTHTDQAPDSKGLKCYQAFVSFTENKERTFVVYECTHKEHEAYFEERGIQSKKNWQLIDHDHVRSIQDKKHVLHVPPGAMVVWDSRVFHQNQYGDPSCGFEERMVQYVCFFPKNHRSNTNAMQEKRKKYLAAKRTTTHWPCPISVVGLQPQTYGNKDLMIDYEKVANQDISEFAEEIEKIV